MHIRPSRQARCRPQLAHRRSQPRPTRNHGAAPARWSAVQDANSRNVLAKDPAQDPTELDQASLRGDPDKHVDRGPHQAPRRGARPVLNKPIDPELCSLHAASSLIEPQLRPLPAGFVLDCSTWTHRHLHGRRTRLAIDRCCSARRPDHRDSRWGRPAHQPPHCSPMGISWGSIPQGSPLSNHPSRRRRAQVRLAAPAERRGGFGTCAQSGRQGDQRTWLYLKLPAHRLSARPDPTRRTYISERGARAQSSGPTSLGRNSLRGTPAWTGPRSDPRVRTRDSSIH